MASGDFTDLATYACRIARLDPTNSSELALAKDMVNDAYMSTCSTGDPWNFLVKEGQFTTTAGSDVYDLASIATAIGVSGAAIEDILSMVVDTTTNSGPIEELGWADLERISFSTQDGDGTGTPVYFAKWGGQVDSGATSTSRIRFYPSPDQNYTIGGLFRLVPTALVNGTDTPLFPMGWRRRLLSIHAAATLLRMEGGLEATSEAERLEARFAGDFITFRTAYATRPASGGFGLFSAGWRDRDPVTWFSRF